MQTKTVLLIFVKNPESGRVKTRLAETVGDDQALEIYKKLLRYTRSITEPVEADKQIWYSRHAERGDGWNRRDYSKRIQQGKDLGERMQHAFGKAFREGYERVIVIGSDCAELTSEEISRAFGELEKHDLVIGPSADGGYYLLGMRSFHPELFEDVDWSTSRVYRQTIKKAEQAGLNPFILPELNDVDEESDWNTVRDRFHTGYED